MGIVNDDLLDTGETILDGTQLGAQLRIFLAEKADALEGSPTAHREAETAKAHRG